MEVITSLRVCPRSCTAPESLAAYALAASTAVALLAACSTDLPEHQAIAAQERMCAACHGPDGKSASVRAPVLAGQPKGYLVSQLTAFRDHSRSNADGRFFMWPMAAALSDAEIERLAGYFSALSPPAPEPAADTAGPNGQILYEKGAPERGVVPCSSCHGDKGQGMADFPRLAGQHRDYLAAQLTAFADGSRASPIMGSMAKSLSPEDMRTLTAYLASL